VHFLTISDFDKKTIDGMLKRALDVKQRLKRGIAHNALRGKVLGLIFEKSSTRTRVSFEVAMIQLGGSAIFISHRDSQIGRGEPVKDTARVMSRYVDAVVIRTFGHDIIEEFAAHSTIPVINGLTDSHHPCQVLSDILTIAEKKGGYENVNVCWIGDGNNMANSWIEAAGILGFKLKLACPDGHLPDEKILKAGGANATIVKTPEEAAEGADVLNTDVWASMGQEAEAEKRKEAFKNYQINSRILGLAKKDAIVLHCLPAHRGEEITDDVIEGANSCVLDEAENRLHMQKAILEYLMR
jgi:ornithine carbamoyltransferase